DLQVLHRASAYAHVPSHALTREDATGRLPLTDRTRCAVREGRTMGGITAGEIVPFHDTGETLTDRRACDIDDLAFLEQIDLDLATHDEILAFVALQAELHERLPWSDLRLRVMSCERLVHARGFTLADRDLNGAIAVDFLCTNLRDSIRQGFDDRHRHGFARLGENTRHTGLSTDQTQGLGAHRLSSSKALPPATGRQRNCSVRVQLRLAEASGTRFFAHDRQRNIWPLNQTGRPYRGAALGQGSGLGRTGKRGQPAPSGGGHAARAVPRQGQTSAQRGANYSQLWPLCKRPELTGNWALGPGCKSAPSAQCPRHV